MVATKKVLIVITAQIHAEYTETLEVPADISEEELNALVNQRADDIDADDYSVNPYWDCGECYAQDADEGSTVSARVERTPSGELVVSEVAQDDVPAPSPS